jgi:hypothetical protein
VDNNIYDYTYGQFYNEAANYYYSPAFGTYYEWETGSIYNTIYLQYYDNI